MPIVEYTPERFAALEQAVSGLAPNLNLVHRPFVDYYYATRPWCGLFLYLSDSGSILGTVGRDLMRFEYRSGEMTLGICTNWYSRQAGVGRELARFMFEAHPGKIPLMFTGSQITLRILRRGGWLFMPGVRGYVLNRPYKVHPGESRWRGAAKSMIRRLVQKRIPSFASRIPLDAIAGISVREEHSYSEDLLPRTSPFMFRFAPPIEYLSWRYSTSLSFVRYRLFRVIARGENIGYVIINESPTRLIVAQCDGEDATTLAFGVLLSILEVGHADQAPRSVFLTCSHLAMRQVFEGFGFKPRRGGDLPFAMRTEESQFHPSSDTSGWLINFDWGDNGLQPPFRDQPPS